MIDLQVPSCQENTATARGKLHHPGTALERTERCAGCEKSIRERFVFKVIGQSWHADCIQCSDCGRSLTEKCFSRDGKLYCLDDFHRRFGTKCGGCAQTLSPNEFVRRARDQVFHIKCFTCIVCSKELSTGDNFVVDENRLFCKDDYFNTHKFGQVSEDEEEVMDKLGDGDLSDKSSYHDDDDSIDATFPPFHSLTNSHQQTGSVLGGNLDLTGRHPLHNPPPHGPHSQQQKTLNDLNDLNNKNNSQIMGGNHLKIKEEQLDNNDNPKTDLMFENKSDSGSKGDSKGDCSDSEDKGGKGAKRRGPRTTIKAKQLETLKAAFAATPKPTRHIREQLAQETGLNMRVIQVWFQNRRSKERRMKQLSALGARRAFFRNPRRMRGMPDDSADLLGQPGFNFYPDGDFYPGPGFPGAFPGDFPFQGEGGMNFLPPTSGPPGHPMMDQMGGHMGGPHDQFNMGPGHADMGMPPPPSSNTPEPGVPPMQPLDAFTNMPPRSNTFSNNQNSIIDHRQPPGHSGGHPPPQGIPSQEMQHHQNEAPWL